MGESHESPSAKNSRVRTSGMPLKFDLLAFPSAGSISTAKAVLAWSMAMLLSAMGTALERSPEEEPMGSCAMQPPCS